MNNWFKRNGTHLAIIGIFIAICFFYFTPAFQGKTLGQNDVTRAQSTQKEIMDYKAKDTTILWTNQILGGMPTYQIWAPYSSNISSYIINGITRGLPNPVGIVLVLMLGSYFLFSVLKLNPWLAAGGALAFTFSSYNLIYLVAGHANQELAIAFFAPILASVLLTLRGKYLIGSVLLALFLAVEIKANHIQMTYYLLIALLILIGFELYYAIRSKQTATFLRAFIYMGGALVLALAINASVLWSTSEYAGDSIRGKSNLTNANEPSNGLAKDYAYEFSEGVGESLSFMVPNVYGGASGSTGDPNSHVVKTLTDAGIDPAKAQGFAQQLPSYWGDKTFTEGPWYFGAVVCFLFIFGLLVVKNKLKWWILATVVLTMLLSFGKNFPYVSDLFFKYFPLYNKFRAVESILTVTSLCFPILAFLALDEVIKATNKKALVKKLMIALGITGGITFILLAAPDLFLSFRTSNHLDFVNQLTRFVGGDTKIANAIASALVQDRIAADRADAFRSLIFILIGAGLLWAYLTQKFKSGVVLAIAFLAVIVIDLWTVDKRYLKDESFVDKQDVQTPQPREVDQVIMQDKDPDFRVIDLSQIINQDAITPYFYKSVGGYSAARMKRYEEIIENQFSKSINHDVLDMLNTKYIINQDPKTGNLGWVRNESACGHAWFVSKITFVKNADEEMKAITAFSPKDEAIVDQKFKPLVDAKRLGTGVNGTIDLVKYSPDDMVYKSSSPTNAVAVFSEIYYDKGWKMYVDGQEQPYFRADYILRAAVLPVGNHKVEFIFHPASYYTGEKISLAGSILLVLALGGVVFMEVRKKPKTDKKAA